MNLFIETLKHALEITSFVLMMMLIIEYINVQTRGNWSKYLQKKNWLQIIIAGILGLIPGCFGAFTVVALYTHNILNFPALVTVMISAFGDEAFVMLAMIPQDTFKLMIIIFCIAIISGFSINIFFKNKKFVTKDFCLPAGQTGFIVHTDEFDCEIFQKEKIICQLKKISFQRALLLVGFLIFSFCIIIGEFGLTEWNWIRITFLIGSLSILFIVLTVPDHFLNEHLWGHVIKKHLLKIFLWTFGVLLFIHIIENYFNLEAWIKTNQIIILLLAVIIGIIPESGPHLFFVTLFANGSIPFSILLSNSIVQDGHGCLPLLAESRRDFFFVKGINVTIGLIVGLIGYFMGW